MKPDGFDSPALRYFFRRFAAFIRMSRAHVTGFASSELAASCICFFSATVTGISTRSVRRSSGDFFGLTMIVIIRRKTLDCQPKRVEK